MKAVPVCPKIISSNFKYGIHPAELSLYFVANLPFWDIPCQCWKEEQEVYMNAHG
jgi:hypothetical protein